MDSERHKRLSPAKHRVMGAQRERVFVTESRPPLLAEMRAEPHDLENADAFLPAPPFSPALAPSPSCAGALPPSIPAVASLWPGRGLPTASSSSSPAPSTSALAPFSLPCGCAHSFSTAAASLHPCRCLSPARPRPPLGHGGSGLPMAASLAPAPSPLLAPSLTTPTAELEYAGRQPPHTPARLHAGGRPDPVPPSPPHPPPPQAA